MCVQKGAFATACIMKMSIRSPWRGLGGGRVLVFRQNTEQDNPPRQRPGGFVFSGARSHDKAESMTLVPSSHCLPVYAGHGESPRHFDDLIAYLILDRLVAHPVQHPQD